MSEQAKTLREIMADITFPEPTPEEVMERLIRRVTKAITESDLITFHRNGAELQTTAVLTSTGVDFTVVHDNVLFSVPFESFLGNMENTDVRLKATRMLFQNNSMEVTEGNMFITLSFYVFNGI